MTSGGIALLLGAFALAGQAQVRHNAEQRREMFEQYLVKRAAAMTREGLANVRTLADWQALRSEIRRQLLDMLGLEPTPRRTPLNARTTGVIERATHRIEKIVFESMPGLYVTGNLYLPKRVEGKLPVVLYLSGHSPGPYGAKVDYQHHGVWFARHGYAALLLDTLEFGEVPGLHHGTHDLEMWNWLSLGYTPIGPEVWNAVRALDYLETRPEGDMSRAGLTGISGGGAITWFTAALDDRIKVAVPVCSSWTIEHQVALDTVRGNCDCIFIHNNNWGLDLPAIGALIAPRPLKIISAQRDSVFPPAGYREVHRQLRRIYDFYGAADKLAEYEHDAKHADIVPFRKEADEWMNRWLKNDHTPFEEGEIQKEEPEVLRVLDRYPINAVNARLHKSFIHAAQPASPRTLAQWQKRRDELLTQIKGNALRTWPTAKAAFETAKEPYRMWTERYADSFNVEFTSEEGIRVHGQLFIPRNVQPPYPALIHIKGRGDVVYSVDYDYLLGAFASHVVLVLQPRATDYAADNFRMANWKRTASFLGGTLESMQLRDILRSIDFLAEDQRLKLSSISVYGKKEAGALGLYAAAFDQRVTRAIVEDVPASHWSGPALLNILRITDLPEAAAMLAPREIVSLGPLPDSFRLTSSVYSLYGRGAAIREAAALDDALKVWETRR